jgi:uncharacterized protein Yka (UPF0111/DUF47 family)
MNNLDELNKERLELLEQIRVLFKKETKTKEEMKELAEKIIKFEREQDDLHRSLNDEQPKKDN